MIARALRPLQNTALIFGLDFFNKRGIFFTIYRVFILVMFIAFFIHEIPTMHFWVANLSSLHSMLALIQIVLHWTALFILFVLNWKNNQEMRTALLQLQALRLKLAEKRMKKLAMGQWAHLVCFGLLCAVYNVLGHLFVWENGFYDMHTFVIYIITDFFIGFTSIIMTQLVYALFFHFQELNDTLLKLREVFQPTGFVHFPLHCSWKTISAHVVNTRNTHLKLCVISQTINKCFSAQLLLVVLSDMVEIIYSLRSLVFYIARSDDSGAWTTKPVLEFTLTSCWCCLFLGSMIALIGVCDLTVTESHRSRLLTHELINLNCTSSCQRELLIFSQQLNHHTAHFTAGGLLVVRFSLIRSIIGATITYLVIIVTFKN